MNSFQSYIMLKTHMLVYSSLLEAWSCLILSCRDGLNGAISHYSKCVYHIVEMFDSASSCTIYFYVLWMCMGFNDRNIVIYYYMANDYNTRFNLDMEL